jgi:hypothetical protein
VSTDLLKNRQCGIDVLTTRIVQGSPPNCKLNFFGHFLRPSHKERGLAKSTAPTVCVVDDDDSKPTRHGDVCCRAKTFGLASEVPGAVAAASGNEKIKIYAGKTSMGSDPWCPSPHCGCRLSYPP